MIASADGLPLVLALYPRGRARYAAALKSALRVTFADLPEALKTAYRGVLTRLPPLVVVDLRSRNACECLGHHHPSCLYHDVTRRLAADTGGGVGEIDLALDAIREWQPQPLAALATTALAAEKAADFADSRFQAAILSVFLHELEHVAHPEREESVIRRRSDLFYSQALAALAANDFGLAYGFTASPAA